MALIDDKYLGLRFASQPELLLRLDDFTASYALDERPALIAQARPAGTTVASGFIFDKEAFKLGIETPTAWWHGFRSRVGHASTFHGVASLSSHERPTWANELHRDGHFIAGVWEFPSLPVGNTQVAVLAHFYSELFEHFAAIIQRALSPTATKPVYLLTATLINARQLHFSRASEFGSNVVYPPTAKTYLQWPIFEAVVGTEAWSTAAKTMGDALLGASGGARG